MIDLSNKDNMRQAGRILAKVHSIKTEKYGFFDNNIAKEQGKLVGIYKEHKSHTFAALDKNLAYLLDTGVLSAEQLKEINYIFEKNEDLLVCKNPVLINEILNTKE